MDIAFSPGRNGRTAMMKIWRSALWTLALCFCVSSVFGQLTPEQQADMLLGSARKAHNEKQHPFAVAKFREFLQKYPQHKEAIGARFGLALALLDGPDKNYNEARDLLQSIAGNKEMPEHALAVYHLGLAIRGQGMQEWALAQAKPQEAAPRRQNALQRFGEAAPHFANALALFSARVKDIPKEPQLLPADAEWAARARADLAEMQLRVGKTKDAQATAAPFVKDPVLSRSKVRDQGRYFYGFASFLVKDNAQAQASLGMLAPFTQPDFGTHARYLLARTHHLADEKAEAAHHYEGTLAEYAKEKVQAAELLKTPQKFNNDPVVRVRLESILREPAPDHVARANFYLGVLLYEASKFADAKSRFAEFVKLDPQSPLRGEAELRVGFCQVQLKEFADAQKTLAPLVDKDARLSDQALYWIGKAQIGAAPDAATNRQGNQQALSAAVNSFRQAVERAQRIQDQDPEAKLRRGQILLEIADTQQLLKQHRDAANAYNQLLNEKTLPDRDEEIMHRLVVALHLVPDYNESDKASGRFLERHSKSLLLPAVLFTFAENSYFRSLAAEKNPNPAERAKEVSLHNQEAIKRFGVVVDKFPEFARINVARYSLGLAHYRQGDLDSARKILAAIPQTERGGELALVSFLMADCLLRQTPTTIPEDALAAGKLEEQLKSAAELLDQFVAASPAHPQTPDALIKMGLCQQRMAGLLAQPADKAKALAAARAAYERLFAKEFANSPLVPQAILERAKVLAQQPNELGNAQNELRRFTNDPLKNAAVAPMAAIHLATLLRGQNNPAEAANVLGKARELHEANLSKDSERASWIGLLRYHHGVALREAGKLPEARQIFDSVVKMNLARPEGAESALRFAQCLKEEGAQRLEAARKLASNPKEAAQVQKLQDEGYKLARDAVAFLETQAEQLKKSPGLDEIRARMLYEAAWGTRVLAEPEIEATRKVLALELQKKLSPAAAKFPPPPVPLDKVPLQPAEKKARGLYQGLIDGYAEQALAVEARFELAELLAQRNEYEPALKLLGDALDKEPGPELTEKVRLRLGVIHAAKGNLKGALAQFDAVAQNPKSPLLGWAHFRAGETFLANQQYPDAIKRLVLFRDAPPFQSVAGLSDRALLRLGQAYAFVKDWDASRQALDRLAGAFPNSPSLDEARYGIGWAWQQQNNFDQAVNSYAQVTARTATELAAKAQLQIGLCRLEQKRFIDAANAFLVVPFTYDYPELSAAAMLEAANAYTLANQKEQAVRILQRIVGDYPDTPFAEAAKERMEEKKK